MSVLPAQHHSILRRRPRTVPRSVKFGISPFQLWDWTSNKYTILDYLKDQPFINYLSVEDAQRNAADATEVDRDVVETVMREHRRELMMDYAVTGGYVSVSALQYDADAVWFDCDITDRGLEAWTAITAGWCWDAYKSRIAADETQALWRERINGIQMAGHPAFDDIKRITAPELAWVHDAAFHKKLEVWTPT